MGLVKTAQASHAVMFPGAYPFLDVLAHKRPEKYTRNGRERLFATQMNTSWSVMKFMHQSCSEVVISRDDGTRWVKDVHRIPQQRTIKRVTLDVVARWFRQLRE